MSNFNQELTLKFIRERNVFDNDASRVIIGEADTVSPNPTSSPSRITIKGEAAEGQLRHGMLYRFWGRWHEHHKFGKQFVFTTFTVEMPVDEDSVVAYICQCKGIGNSTARNIWSEFGADSVRALREEPEAVATRVKRLTTEMAKNAAATLQGKHKIEKTKIGLLGLLKGRGFPKKTIDEAMSLWGSAAVDVVSHNPYKLMAIRGCGFGKTDKMYLELGHPPARMKRQALCAWYALASDSEGHTWYPESFALGAVTRSVSGGKVNAPKAIRLALKAKMLAKRVDEAGCVWIAENLKAMHESRIATAVEVATKEKNNTFELPGPLKGLSEHQSEELNKALKGSISILCGSPGTGKTFTAAALIKEIANIVGEESICVCAPTGKAAVRLTEAMQANGLQIEAITIHRMLVVKASDGGFTFEFGKGNPLPYSFVVIDEASMIDAPLMASLLEARDNGTQFLFLGDTNQLPPVGHGAPLRDLIAAGVPSGELREIRRNSGRIVQSCATIRDNQQYQPSQSVDLEAGENLMHVETSGNTQTIERIQQLLKRIQAEKKYDPVWEVQILCALNKKSELARKALNDMLQPLLNPMGEQVNGNRFRVGDKVICLKNTFCQAIPQQISDDDDPLDPLGQPDPLKSPDHKNNSDSTKAFVANGDIGEVVNVEPSRTFVKMDSPARLVIVPHGPQKKTDDESNGSIEGDNTDDSGSGSDWDLAYAISCHKSQGSEFPLAVILLDESGGASRVCSRNWLYTAISRAKKLGICIGPKRIAAAMCRRDGLNRKTFLQERIHELAPQLKMQSEPVCNAAANNYLDSPMDAAFDLDSLFDVDALFEVEV